MHFRIDSLRQNQEGQCPRGKVLLHGLKAATSMVYWPREGLDRRARMNVMKPSQDYEAEAVRLESVGNWVGRTRRAKQDAAHGS